MSDDELTLTVTYRIEVVDELALREAGFRAIRDDGRLALVFEGREDNATNALGVLLRNRPKIPGVRYLGHTVRISPLREDQLP
jgi:hypothetical protein